MNELFPIIRRKRRPLSVPEDAQSVESRTPKVESGAPYLTPALSLPGPRIGQSGTDRAGEGEESREPKVESVKANDANVTPPRRAR